MSSEKDSRLSRWSRRKAETRVRRGGAAPGIEAQAEPEGQAPATVDTGGQDAAPPELPDVETLTPESDFSQFMQEGVPTALRKLALRKLWAGDPALTELDEMLEYGGDFTEGGALIGKLKDAADGLKRDREKPSERPETEPATEEVTEIESGSDAENSRRVEESGDSADDNESAEDGNSPATRT